MIWTLTLYTLDLPLQNMDITLGIFWALIIKFSNDFTELILKLISFKVDLLNKICQVFYLEDRFSRKNYIVESNNFTPSVEILAHSEQLLHLHQQSNMQYKSNLEIKISGKISCFPHQPSIPTIRLHCIGTINILFYLAKSI